MRKLVWAASCDYIYNHYQVFIIDGIPLICGGDLGDYPDNTDTDKCFKYIPSIDTWEESGTMSGGKYGHAAYYTESWGLAMAEAGAPLEAYFPKLLGNQASIFENVQSPYPAFGQDSGPLCHPGQWPSRGE